MTEWQGFYSTSQVSRLARIPRRTLYDWKAKGIIEPSVAVIEDGEAVDFGYSYSDLTIVKLMRALREDKLNLNSVGIALKHLFERLGPPSKGWAGEHVYIIENYVFAERSDEWETTAATQLGQKVETRLFGDLFRDLKEMEEEGSILVPKNFTAYIEINPNIMDGEPVIRGTRVPTSVITTQYYKGKSVYQLAQLYRPIPQNSIEKAIEFEQFLDSPITTARTNSPRR